MCTSSFVCEVHFNYREQYADSCRDQSPGVVHCCHWLRCSAAPAHGRVKSTAGGTRPRWHALVWWCGDSTGTFAQRPFHAGFPTPGFAWAVVWAPYSCSTSRLAVLELFLRLVLAGACLEFWSRLRRRELCSQPCKALLDIQGGQPAFRSTTLAVTAGPTCPLLQLYLELATENRSLHTSVPLRRARRLEGELRIKTLPVEMVVYGRALFPLTSTVLCATCHKTGRSINY